MEISMKRYLTKAVGVAILMFIALSVQPSQAQVYLDFGTIKSVQSETYTPLTGATIILPNDFKLGTDINGQPKADRDNGYYKLTVPTGFQFEYNGELVSQIWICVNGFITFKQPEMTPAIFNDRLFARDDGYPQDVIAPYWGDHYYADGDDVSKGYVPGQIAYKFANDMSSLTIEWKNLNINLQNLYPRPETNVPKSSASFQVILKKSTNNQTAQGDIEFAYGLTSGDPNASRLQNAAIGIRGEVGDYLNGLIFEGNPLGLNPAYAKTFTNKSSDWQPSGGTDWRIVFKAIQRFYLTDNWGDGDVDLSHASIGKHYGLPQNQFVTPEDERMILNSIATGDTLDPARRRQAYHGDVNHNGRYYYNAQGVKVNIPLKDMIYTDHINVAPYNAIEKQIRFEVTEYDAALIMHYRSAGILELPWLLDTIPVYGKVSTKTADALVMGEASRLSENEYRFPLYLNGSFNGPVAFSFSSDVEIVNIERNIDNANSKSSFSANKGVYAAVGNFVAQAPVCYVTVKSGIVNLTNVRLNDNEVASMSGNFTSTEQPVSGINTVVCAPNVVSSSATFTMNVATAGEYNIAIYDAIGNKVGSMDKTVAAGVTPVDFNTAELTSGVYFVKVNGQNVTMTSKFVVSK